MSKHRRYLAQKFGAVDSLAKIIPLRGKEEGLGVRGVASFGRGLGSSGKYAPRGYSSRMFPDFTLLGKDWISGLFSVGWATSGMVYRGEVWMLNISDSPNDASVCLLSDVLESHVHPKYFLSARAAEGILRRCKKRDVILPKRLRDALTTTADSKRPSSEHSQAQAPNGDSVAPKTQGTDILLSKRTPETNSASDSPRPASKTMEENRSLGFAGLPRRLTPTECERLQGFPDDWTRLIAPAAKPSETP